MSDIFISPYYEMMMKNVRVYAFVLAIISILSIIEEKEKNM